MIDLPTTRARALIEDVTAGRGFFGAEGMLPAYYEELEPLVRATSPTTRSFVLDDPPAITKALREELERATQDARGEGGRAGVPPGDVLRRRGRRASRELAKRAVVALHRTPVVGEESGRGVDRRVRERARTRSTWRRAITPTWSAR